MATIREHAAGLRYDVFIHFIACHPDLMSGAVIQSSPHGRLLTPAIRARATISPSIKVIHRWRDNQPIYASGDGTSSCNDYAEMSRHMLSEAMSRLIVGFQWPSLHRRRLPLMPYRLRRLYRRHQAGRRAPAGRSAFVAFIARADDDYQA